MEIRNIAATDFEAIHALMVQLQALHISARPDIYGECDPLTQEHFADLLDPEKYTTFVAEHDGTAIGFCAFRLREFGANPPFAKRRVAFVDDICVDEKFRQQGIGEALMDAARDRAREMKCDSVELMVWGFNEDAFEFYQALGMDVRSYIMEEKL